MFNKKEIYWSLELAKIKSILDENKVSFFLDHGTLLGAVRDNRFIPWDNDIDLGVAGFSKSEKNKIIRKLVVDFQSLGYLGKYSGDSVFLFKEGIEFGIKFYEEDDDFFKGVFIEYKTFSIYSTFYFLSKYSSYEKYNSFSRLKNIIYSSTIIKFLLNPFENFFLRKSNIKIIKLEIPKHFFNNLKEIDFYNSKYKIPKEEKEYLSFKYGESWDLPKKNYNYIEDDGAISNKKK
jgi:lipopolysaccharide cholinephosphotransferase